MCVDFFILTGIDFYKQIWVGVSCNHIISKGMVNLKAAVDIFLSQLDPAFNCNMR